MAKSAKASGVSSRTTKGLLNFLGVCPWRIADSLEFLMAFLGKPETLAGRFESFLAILVPRENDADEKVEDKSVKIGHDEETNDSDDDAPEFDAVISRDAADEIIGNLAVIDNHQAAGDKNRETAKEPTEAKIPFHAIIIAQNTENWEIGWAKVSENR